MLTYLVTSDAQRVIDGLGVFEPDVTQVFTEQEAAMFKTIRGVPLLQTNVPAGVTVTIFVVEDQAEEGN